jgi:uncharacterized protein YgiM (DUF1202 family)
MLSSLLSDVTNPAKSIATRLQHARSHCSAYLTTAVVAIATISGCNGAQDDNLPKGNWNAGTAVTVVKEEGDYALVRDNEGNEAYVRSTLLKQRGTFDEGTHSHTLSADSKFFDQAPSNPPAPPPRPPNKITGEQLGLNILYLTEKSNKEVIAPFITVEELRDPETGEKCWPALMCVNPDCPAKGKGRDGGPFVFIHPHPGTEIVCPECAKTRNPATETPEQRYQYRSWVRQYELPETKARIKELDAERRRASEARRARKRDGGVTPGSGSAK